MGDRLDADLARLREEDANARLAALNLTRSFIVQAPAGSGKTELLIQRYLALLTHVNLPEEIVAITFTRKATGEMRARVLTALDEAYSATPPLEPHKRVTWEIARRARDRDAHLQWNVLENPNRLRIQTIDSLCHWLTLQLPLLSGFGAQPQTVEDAAELYAEAARRTLAGLGEGNEWSVYIARILRHLDNHMERVQQLIAYMLRVRDQWIRTVLDPRGRNRSALEAAFAETVRSALARLASLVPSSICAGLPALAAYAADCLGTEGNGSSLQACRGMTTLPDVEICDLEAWRGLAAMLLTREGELRSRITVLDGFPPPSSARGAERRRREDAKQQLLAMIAGLAHHRSFVEQLDLTRSLPPVTYSEAQWELVEALTGVLPVAAAQLEVLFREHGQVDFTAVSQAAVRALGDAEAPTDLALALDHRIRHILVDEFQDTSWSQYELLKGLTAGWGAGDGHTLFVVGDPMQSIYRFRKAEVGLYLRAWREGIGSVALTPLKLAVNFRSTRAVVEWINRAFEAVLPDAPDAASGSVPFAPSVTADSAARGATPEFHPLLTMDRDAEARLVVDLVQRRLAADPAQTIAILVRARTHLVRIAPMLKAAGLNFQAIEIEELKRRPIVQDLLVLTRALIHPADRTAWLAILRAPWCGLTLADLEAIAGHDHEAAVWTLMNDATALARVSMDGRARLERVRSIAGAALARRRREPLRRWIESVWLALGGPACAEKPSDLDDAGVYFELLTGLDEGGDLPRLERLTECVEELYAASDSNPSAQRLQLMTMHKAKGLEFNAVILPGLGYPPRREEARLLLFTERPRFSFTASDALNEDAKATHDVPRLVNRGASKEGIEADLLIAPIREATEKQSAIYDYLNALEDAKDRHEASRLLYVAATRARSRLDLIGQVDGGFQDLKPRSGSLLEHLWPVVEIQFVHMARNQPQAETSTVLQRPTATIRRCRSGWRPPAPPSSLDWHPRPTVEYAGRSPHDEIEFSWASETTKHVGSVVHRFLQLIAAQGLEKWGAGRIVEMRDVYIRDLRRLGVPEQQMAKAATRVADALCAAISGERGRWVLGRHTDAQSELRLTGAVGGELVNIAIDRTFVDDSGVRWIVDFKTGAHEGAERDAFLDSEQERYRLQLERYAALLRALDERPLRLGLYFPLLEGWREWEPK
jgi:ATP-dependent helicase/nuclease subunit A